MRAARPLVLYLLLATLAVGSWTYSVFHTWAYGGAARSNLGIVMMRARAEVIVDKPEYGLEAGDVMVALNGVETQSCRTRESIFRRALSQGTIDLTFQRPDGTTYMVEAPVTIRPTFVRFTNLILFVVGLLLFWIHPRPGETFAMFVMCMAPAILDSVFLSSLCTTNDIQAALTGAISLAGGGLLNLALLLPWPVRLAVRHPWLGTAAYAVAASIGVALSTVNVLVFNDLVSADVYIQFSRISDIFILLSMLTFVGTLVARWYGGPSPVERWQLAVATLAVTFVAVRLAMSIAVPLITSNETVYALIQTLGAVFFAIAVALMIVCVFGQRIVAIDYTVSRSLLPGLVWLLGLGCGPALITYFCLQVPGLLAENRAVTAAWVFGSYLLFLIISYFFARRFARREHGVPMQARVLATYDLLYSLYLQPLSRCAAMLEHQLPLVLRVSKFRIFVPSEGDRWEAVSDHRDRATLAELEARYHRVEVLEDSGERAGIFALGEPTNRAALDLGFERLFETLCRRAATAITYRRRGRRIGEFDVVGRMGEGGFARVYVGLQRGSFGSQQLVAIKTPKVLPTQNTDIDFAKECETAELLRHPNIVRVVGHGTDQGEPFLALKLVQGVDAQHLLAVLNERNERLPVTVAAYILREVARALAHAHRGDRGRPALLHRDVSLDNILLAPDGQVLLSDFGAAMLESEESRRIVGKARYLAPESLESPPTVSVASDLYAVGIVAYFLLTGRHPYPRTSREETYLAAKKGGHASPRSVRPEIPPELDDLVMQLLSLDPARRPASSDALLEHLAPFAPKQEGPVRKILTAQVIRCGAVWERERTFETSMMPATELIDSLEPTQKLEDV